MPASTRKPARATMNAKNARRIVRNYLRASIVYHAVVPNGKAKADTATVESLRARVDRFDARLNEALRTLAAARSAR